jgi:hypothetical protein
MPESSATNAATYTTRWDIILTEAIAAGEAKRTAKSIASISRRRSLQ